MAFKLKSGNKVSFKEMGSSPVKRKPIDFPETIKESPISGGDTEAKGDSPAKLKPSYIGEKMVSDIEADWEEKAQMKEGIMGEDIPKERRVTHTGNIARKKIIQSLTPKEKKHYEQTGKLGTLARTAVEETRPGGERGATREEELEAIKLNKAMIAKQKLKKKKSTVKKTKKSSPAKIIPIIAALAPMLMGAMGGKK